MIRKKIQIINKLGLHARAAAKLVSTASQYQSHVELSREDKTVNGKSIMGLMMLGATQNAWIEVCVAGQDEAQAMNQLETLIQNRFGEAQ